MTRRISAAAALLVATFAAAAYTPDITPITWPDGATTQLAQAAAIVEAYEQSARECESALRERRMSDYDERQCHKSIDIGTPNSRYVQAAKKLVDLGKDTLPPRDASTLKQALDSALRASRHWLFIRERLTR